jgi:hypothetical protein
MFESPVLSIHIPVALRGYVNGHEEVTVSGETVGELIAAVGHEYPEILSCLLSGDGALKKGWLLFLGGQDVATLQGMETPVDLEVVLSIVPSKLH